MTTPAPTDDLAAEQFARKVTAHLASAEAALPYVVTERLRAARHQAVAQRKRGVTALQPESAPDLSLLGTANDGTALLGGHSAGDNTPLWVRRLLTALPLIALLGALTMMGIDQDSRATVDVAELDAALLTSELPPAAYTDPGFLQYLQTSVTDTP